MVILLSYSSRSQRPSYFYQSFCLLALTTTMLFFLLSLSRRPSCDLITPLALTTANLSHISFQILNDDDLCFVCSRSLDDDNLGYAGFTVQATNALGQTAWKTVGRHTSRTIESALLKSCPGRLGLSQNVLNHVNSAIIGQVTMESSS